MPDRQPTWREFDDFRKEARDAHKSLELKLWGLVVTEFFLVVGYLFTQFRGAGATQPVGAIVLFVMRHIGM